MVSMVELSRRTSQRGQAEIANCTKSRVNIGDEPASISVGRRRRPRPLNLGAKAAFVTLVISTSSGGANNQLVSGFSPLSRFSTPHHFPTAGRRSFPTSQHLHSSCQPHKRAALHVLPPFFADVATVPSPEFLHNLFSARDGGEMALNAASLSFPSLLQAFTGVSTTDAMSDPKVEAEVLNDVAHLALDLAAFLSPETFLLRLSAVFGRLCAMASDYVADSSMNVDELFFQLTLLSVSVSLLLKSAMPIIKATLVRTTDLDDLVYEQLFEPVGITWLQYKAIVAASCLNWTTLPPGTVLVSEDEIANINQQDAQGGNDNESHRSNLYWLYRGDVVISYDGKPMSLISRTKGKPIDDPSAVGFLADMRFLYDLDRKTKAQIRKRTARQRRRSLTTAATTSADEVSTDNDEQKYPMATISVGPQGATLMTVDSNRLFDLMDNDEHLSSSIRALLLKSLQRKVGELLRSRAATLDDQLQQQQDAAMAMAMVKQSSILWEDSTDTVPSTADDRVIMPSELAP